MEIIDKNIMIYNGQVVDIYWNYWMCISYPSNGNEYNDPSSKKILIILIIIYNN